LRRFGAPDLSEIQYVCYCYFSVNPNPIEIHPPMNESDSTSLSADAPGPVGQALTAINILIFRSYLLQRQAPGLTQLDKT
jgi:hypothetical protein